MSEFEKSNFIKVVVMNPKFTASSGKNMDLVAANNTEDEYYNLNITD